MVEKCSGAQLRHFSSKVLEQRFYYLLLQLSCSVSTSVSSLCVRSAFVADVVAFMNIEVQACESKVAGRWAFLPSPSRYCVRARADPAVRLGGDADPMHRLCGPLRRRPRCALKKHWLVKSTYGRAPTHARTYVRSYARTHLHHAPRPRPAQKVGDF